MKILLIFTLCLISDGGASKAVTGYLGGGVLIKCEYDILYIQNEKYFCKDSRTVCSDQIKTGVKNTWVHSGRFSLYDDTKIAEFKVMIRELTIQDNGTYLCGVAAQSPKGVYSQVELNVKKGVSVSREVTAYAETRSNIKCTYEDEYKDKIKSFCKIETDQRCLSQIKTNTKGFWAHDGRFSIHDNKSAGFFSVFMRELVTEDTGTYACAVHLPDESEIYTIVKLNVTQALSNKTSISVHVGENLTVSCKYPESYRNNPKFLCKRPELAACFYNKTVKQSMRYINEGRISLYDDREKQIFTVSFNHVTEQDSGEYWCGAEVNWTSDHGYKVYFTQVILTVNDGGDSKEVTGYLGGRVLIKCKYDIKYQQNEKYFCKDSTSGCVHQTKAINKNEWINAGRISLYDDTKTAEFKVMIRELTIQDNGTYLCGVDAQSPKGVYSQVELKVKKGVLVSREVTAYAETRSNIKCTYEDEYKDKIKSFCKIETDQRCSNQIKTNTKTEWSHDGRFSIHDNKSAGFFSVFIGELVTADTGTYACAVHLHDESEIYTIVKLNVTQGFPFVTVITVSVSLLVLLVGISFLIWTLHRKCKLKGQKTITHVPTETNGGNQNYPVAIYETLNSNLTIYENYDN